MHFRHKYSRHNEGRGREVVGLGRYGGDVSKLPTGNYKIDDYREFARRARKELRRDPRQAVEKSYLAAVHAARQIVACAGEPWKGGKRQSSAAIGRAFECLGKRSGLDYSG